jgi:hypothetical protein
MLASLDSRNSFKVGAFALSSNSFSGDSNFAIGNCAGRIISSGINNIAFGENSLASNISGNDNVAIGNRSLQSSIHSHSIAIGTCANTTRPSAAGFQLSVSIGHQAAYATALAKSVVIGAQAHFQATDSFQAVVIGNSAARCGVHFGSVVIGTNSGYSSSVARTGAGQGGEIAIGTRTLQAISSTLGPENYAIGYDALCNMSSGSGNIAIGARALAGINNARFNIGIGHEALRTTQGTGSGGEGGSIAIGFCASPLVATNTANSLYLGALAGANATANAGSATVLNTIYLGNPAVSTIYTNGTLQGLSDNRDKTDIEDLPVGLEFIRNMRPVKFTWNARDGSKVDQNDIGFIAQELEALVNESNVNEWLGLVELSNPDLLQVTPDKLIPVIIRAIQELADQDDKEIADLTAELEELNNRLG